MKKEDSEEDETQSDYVKQQRKERQTQKKHFYTNKEIEKQTERVQQKNGTPDPTPASYDARSICVNKNKPR
jgi:hypothetical protein